MPWSRRTSPSSLPNECTYSHDSSSLASERHWAAIRSAWNCRLVSKCRLLREHLRSRGGTWEAELAPTKPVRVAVNQDMAAPGLLLADGDEVAFFPP